MPKYDFYKLNARMGIKEDSESSDKNDNKVESKKKNITVETEIDELPRTSSEFPNRTDIEAKSSSNHSIGSSKGKRTTLGKGWFDLEPMEMTDELRRDLKMIKMRSYVDPKRFYKAPDKMNKVLHVGTVIEGPADYLSSRLTRKERKQSLLEEIISDDKVKNYTKRVYNQIQTENSNKTKMFKSRKKYKSKNMKALF